MAPRWTVTPSLGTSATHGHLGSSGKPSSMLLGTGSRPQTVGSRPSVQDQDVPPAPGTWAGQAAGSRGHVQERQNLSFDTSASSFLNHFQTRKLIFWSLVEQLK